MPVKDRYEKQRDKLTRDLAKLEDRQEKFLRLLGHVRIKTYVFFVPFFDSYELIQHASDKTQEYRDKHLPHLDPDFHIVVLDEDAYADTREQVLQQPRALIDVEISSPEQVRAWIEANEELVATADTKLRDLVADEPRRLKVIEGLIGQYVNGENALERMRSKYPENWEFTSRYRNHKEQLLVLEYPSDSVEFGNLAQIAKEIDAELGRDVPALDGRLRTVIAWASIADWLMRCPLSFPSPTS
ncbi:hypothetical protein [Microbispora hainanensis]|uniref:Uncharacterized protein n=1 Tax=Microbispora hainanensis TaxID=568844 RepID=A0A544XSE2_9ACTN|nr:hypothetical protein [Microbispora hainanensis]TQS07419.1 hypothetical protein FLX08_39385 [Microbispora hainanensis]